MKVNALLGADDPRGTLVVVASEEGLPEAGVVVRGWTEDALGEDMWVIYHREMDTESEHLAGNCLVLDDERMQELRTTAAKVGAAWTKRDYMRAMRALAREAKALGLTAHGDVVEDVADWEIGEEPAHLRHPLYSGDIVKVTPADVAAEPWRAIVVRDAPSGSWNVELREVTYGPRGGLRKGTLQVVSRRYVSRVQG